MDFAKMFAGTATRGVLWICSYIAAKTGVNNIDQATADAVGYFIASALIGGAAMIWSAWKNKKLLNTPAPTKDASQS